MTDLSTNTTCKSHSYGAPKGTWAKKNKNTPSGTKTYLSYFSHVPLGLCTSLMKLVVYL